VVALRKSILEMTVITTEITTEITSAIMTVIMIKITTVAMSVIMTVIVGVIVTVAMKMNAVVVGPREGGRETEIEKIWILTTTARVPDVTVRPEAMSMSVRVSASMSLNLGLLSWKKRRIMSLKPARNVKRIYPFRMRRKRR
jgi:hypothetical protein